MYNLIYILISRKAFLAIVAIAGALVVSGCSGSLKESASPASDKYNADVMAKEWREQVRKNPRNPYEGYNLPADNDSDYKSPKKIKPKKFVNSVDEDDSSYGRFPRYNPDDDNMPIDSSSYPLYMGN